MSRSMNGLPSLPLPVWERGHSRCTEIEWLHPGARETKHTSAVGGSFEWHAPPLPDPLPRGERRLAPGEKYGVTSAPAHPLKGEEFVCLVLWSAAFLIRSLPHSLLPSSQSVY